jgi:hypothetical protein
MILDFKRAKLLLIAIAVLMPVAAIEKDKDGKWTPPSLDSLEHRQTNNGVTIGAQAYKTPAAAKPVFDVNPYEHGILPVFVVIKNDSQQAIRLDKLRAEYIDAGRNKLEAIPANEVKYSNRGPKRPNYGRPSPIPGISFGRKNPLDRESFETRGFAAKMLPPGETASGFIYFQTGHRSGDKLYITGLEEAGSGKELFYFELAVE